MILQEAMPVNAPIMYYILSHWRRLTRERHADFYTSAFKTHKHARLGSLTDDILI